MRLDKFKRYNRLLIGGHTLMLSNDDVNTLRLLLNGQKTQPVFYKRIPPAKVLRCMTEGEVIVIDCAGVNAFVAYAKARRLSVNGAHYVYRKLDNRLSIIARCK